MQAVLEFSGPLTIRVDEVAMQVLTCHPAKTPRAMAIANAVQRGSTVYVYNEKNQQLFTQHAGTGPKDGLKGYTGSSVNIQRGSTIYSYNEKGQQTGTQYAG